MSRPQEVLSDVIARMIREGAPILVEQRPDENGGELPFPGCSDCIDGVRHVHDNGEDGEQS